MARPDRVLFLLLAGATWVYVILRAWLVPVTHDEAGAFHMFVLTGDFVPFVARPDAGNHFIQDLLAQLSYFLLGQNLFGLRIWNVAAFGLYAWYLWRCGDLFKARTARWCAWAVLLCVPFAVEFFSLARGYGLSVAFWAMAWFHTLRFMERGRRMDLVMALLGTILALWSVLSSLMMAGGIIAMLGLRAWLRDRSHRRLSLAIWAMLGVVPWVLAVLFAFHLRERDALYAGSHRGYLDGTIASLGEHVIGLWGIQIPIILVLLVSSVAGLLCLRYGRQGGTASMHALGILLGALLFDALAQSTAHIAMGSNVPTDRMALYLIQPAIMSIALGIDALGTRWPWVLACAPVLLALPGREVRRANLSYTMLWRDQAIPTAFYHAVDALQRRSGRLLLVGAQRFQANSTWSFSAHSLGLAVNELDPIDFPQPLCDLLIIDTTMHTAPPGFRTVAVDQAIPLNLMERVSPLRLRTIVDSTFSSPMSTDEHRLFWAADAEPYRGRSLVLEVISVIRSSRGTSAAEAHVKMTAEDGSWLFSRSTGVDHQRGSTGTGSFIWATHIPVVPDSAARLEFGSYNPGWRRFAMDSVRVRIFMAE